MTTPIKLEATTPRFNPMPPLSIGSKVLDGTFVTRNPPDVERTAAVVALCPIPYERRGTDDLGWHIADFLAFKALIAPCANPRTQVWLANADVEAAAKNDPHAYSRGPGHGGNGRRNVVGAAGDGIPIIVEPSAPKLLIKFITEITSKAQKAKENDDTMLIIVCGLATLEQDVFFGGGGKGGYDVSITSEQIREAIGSDVRVTFVTPSMTSAGWQVNPSFNHRTVVTQAKPIDFLARQSGGIFGSNIRQHFLSWESPVIDQATAGPTTGPAVDSTIESVRNVRGAYPGPANMNDHQKAARAAFEVKIHEALTSRMARHRGDHSFSFEAMDDDWETLVGPRKGLKLEKLAGLWERLEELPSTAGYGLYFLGNAFGGNKKSQINHIKHMIRESLNSWPGYYATSFGRGVQKELGDFLRSDMPEDLDCHAMFNALEHRMSLMVLGDLVVKNVGLVSAFNMRCRDWDEPKFAELVSESRMQVFSEVFGVINRNIPIMGMPPGRNLNDQRKLHVKLTRAIRFMAGALIMRYREMGTGLDSATGQIVQLVHDIRDHQVKLLSLDPHVQKLGTDWLDTIGVAARKFATNVRANQTTLEQPGCASNYDVDDSHGVFETPLSVHAPSFVPRSQMQTPILGFQADTATPSVNIQPPLPIKVESPITDGKAESCISANNDVLRDFADLSLAKKENIKPLALDKADELHIDMPMSPPPDAPLEKSQEHVETTSMTETNEFRDDPSREALGTDPEAHLPPHKRTQYRPKTPIRKAVETATDESRSEQNDVPVPRKTPPHLRAPKTHASVPVIKYR